MAPKKKKKLASNAARGFATTSTVSKSKIPEVAKENIKPEKTEDNLKPSRNDDVATRQSSLQKSERELHELTPNELEAQLEESNLQTLLDTCGDKCRKDALRQVARLRTERRLLQSQAEKLYTNQWLPQEIVQLVTNHLEVHPEESNVSQNSLDSPLTKFIAEDQLLLKLWTLRMTLLQLGFSEHSAGLTLREILIKKCNVDTYSHLAGKDIIWGLEKSLDWLALTAGSEEVPNFEGGIPDDRFCLQDPQHSGAPFPAGKMFRFALCLVNLEHECNV